MWVRLARPLAAVLALALAACGRGERPGTPPRHAVLITVSALRADHVTALGYPRATTYAPREPGVPDLSFDGLLASGVAFARAYAPAADDAVALESLLTGRRAEPAAPDAARAPALAEELADAGFLTAAFVTGVPAEHADATGLLRGFAHVGRGAGADPDYDAVRQAVTWLRERAAPSDARVFLWLHLSGPAAPYDAPPIGKEDFVRRFVDPDYDGAADGSAETLARLADPDAPLDGRDRFHLLALYDAEVAHAAYLVQQTAVALAGRFGLLPRDVLAESALVIAGTRGANLLQHGRLAEDPTSLHDASLHVPLALRHPASLTGRRVLAETVELADVAPTLRAWLGRPARDDAGAGRSLLDLTDAAPRGRFASRALVLRRADGGSVRADGWHLVVRGAETRLYDTTEDPLERFDVAAEHPERARELARLLAEP